ncbi:DUF3786 domain-containing protein [Thiovibrio frasassiensis]|uniref:DUF3786 domain-containing protein n=1 Tax=Thiovibrio frasassiensis TaxID=2984131 RepID=A0A9X4MEV3_9BACT|nr:DUF3786 domain-containing protein [Thiovibrio frasassiensis]MDG4474963.1 DUF3786 domain-containing protein [Thiovibrio frasassiensis]
MSEIKNPLEIYGALAKTNCGECGVPSCMAFAAAVLQGQKKLVACPYLDPAAMARLSQNIVQRRSLEDDHQQAISQLQQQVAGLDFSLRAPCLGARLVDGNLAINSLGKDFIITPAGEMVSECHLNHWVYVPLLHYVIVCQGKEPLGEWVPYSTLPGASEWSQYFSHRCEEPLRQLADAHSDLVFEMLHLFGAKPATLSGGADHSLVILPLPKVPFLINYWEPEEGFPSKLNILLDRTAGENINAQSVNLLARGIIEMFRQLILRHSRDGKLF